MFDPLKHNYYKKLMKLLDEGKIPCGRLPQVDVYHDDWCRIHRGGYCNREPDIIVWPPPERNRRPEGAAKNVLHPPEPGAANCSRG